MKAHRVRNVILSAAELDEGKGCGGKSMRWRLLTERAGSVPPCILSMLRLAREIFSRWRARATRGRKKKVGGLGRTAAEVVCGPGR